MSTSADARAVQRAILGGQRCPGGGVWAGLDGATIPCADCGRRVRIMADGRVPEHRPRKGREKADG
jgi:hypothetical protein